MTDSNFSTIFDCFVISLERTPERLRTFREKNERAQLNFQYFKAVDGAQLSPTDIYGSIVATGATRYTLEDGRQRRVPYGPVATLR
jgi:GR25 family glycosyltransferase involved in LPS biosynthesis